MELICPLEKGASLPPLNEEFLSSEYYFARYSKLVPFLIESEISSVKKLIVFIVVNKSLKSKNFHLQK